MEVTDWTFPTLAQVWEYRNGAILAGGTRLDQLSEPDRERSLAALGERVRALLGRLDDGWLLTTSFWMAEDLFKSLFREFDWTPGVRDYINATAAAVVAELEQRGYALHYVVDACEGDANHAAMLEYIPAVFEAAGFAVVCPQIVAAQMLMQTEDVTPPLSWNDIQRYRDEGHEVADQIVTRWHQDRRSSAYLNLDRDDGLPGLCLDVALSAAGSPGTAVVFRDQAPTEGSHPHIAPPPGVAMPSGSGS